MFLSTRWKYIDINYLSQSNSKFKFVYSHIFSEDILMDIEKNAITEEDVHNWKRRRLRVAKSAESLINLPNRDHRLSRHFDDFPRINSCSGIFIQKWKWSYNQYGCQRSWKFLVGWNSKISQKPLDHLSGKFAWWSIGGSPSDSLSHTL